MSQFCGCMGSTKPEPRTQIPAYPDAGFDTRPETQMAMHPPQYDSVDNGYSPVVPLPRYTPRPMSIHEKTLDSQMQQHTHHKPDEKTSQDFDDSDTPALNCHSTGSSSATVTGTATGTTTIMDDASSAYSFPSSFGHTSTETRDTPPPPYSSCGSSFYARSRASSVRSHRSQRQPESLFNYPLNTGNALEDVVPPPAAAMIAPPPPAHLQMSHQRQYQSVSISGYAPAQMPRQLMNARINTPNQRRLSWESQ